MNETTREETPLTSDSETIPYTGELEVEQFIDMPTHKVWYNCCLVP